MFLSDCPTCGRRELRGVRSLISIPDPAGRPVLAAACRSCGTFVAATGPALPSATPATVAA